MSLFPDERGSLALPRKSIRAANTSKRVAWGFALVLLFTSTVTVSSAEACSCALSSVQTSYYSADDVFVGRVAYSAQVGFMKWYVVRVRFTLKGCLKTGQWVYLRTAAESVACGLNLNVGQTYYLNGTQTSNGWSVPVLAVNSCAHNKKVSDLTSDEREWLLGRYNCCGDSCACVDGTPPVSCFANPCDMVDCPAGDCVANYCGGCYADYFNALGEPMCAPCDKDSDCPGTQHCSLEHMCVWNCEDNDDCNPGYWCSPMQNSEGQECRAYQTEGEACGGTTPAWAAMKCLPELVCADFSSFQPAGGGICRKPCESNADCASGQYCGSGNVCREDGSCQLFSDCNVEGNLYMTPFCIGYPVCSEEQCGWICGNPQCPDVEAVDFGPCDAELGWAHLDGVCTLVSGCDGQGYSFYETSTACQAACGQLDKETPLPPSD